MPPRALRPALPQGSLLGLLREAWQEFERDHARYFAIAMVYYALVSLLPLLLLLLAALGLLLRFSDVAGDAAQRVLDATEAALGPPMRASVEQLLGGLQRESVVATVVGLAALLLTASTLFRHLRLGFRAIWRHTPPLVAGPARVALRATLLEFLAAYAMLLAGGLLLLLALAVVAVTQWLGQLVVQLPVLSRTPAWLLALPSSLLIVGLTFALLFRYLPPERLPWRHVWLATVLCTVAWTIGAELLVLSGSVLRQGPAASTALGGMLAGLLWLRIGSQLLFYGAEVCKVSAWRAGFRERTDAAPVPLVVPVPE